MSQVRFNQAGYVGMSRSARATEAEENGRLPLTRAIPLVASEAGVTRQAAREALLASHDGEWHHTGKYARETNYYDVQAAIDWLRLEADPLGDDTDEAEWCETRMVMYAGQLRPFYSAADVRYHLTTAEIKALGLDEPDPHASTIREQEAARLEHAASFRRWESALRRLA